MNGRVLAVVATVLCTHVNAAEAQVPPAGYEERCHPKPLGGGAVHCHVVPVDSVPSWKSGQAGTLVPQAVVGLLAGVLVGGGAGLTTYLALGGDFRGPCNCEVATAIVVGVTTFPGLALGVWGVGELMGGDGSLGWTMLGAFALGCLGALGAYHATADVVYSDELDQYDKPMGAPVGRPLYTGRPRPTFAVPLIRLQF